MNLSINLMRFISILLCIIFSIWISYKFINSILVEFIPPTTHENQMWLIIIGVCIIIILAYYFSLIVLRWLTKLFRD